jgi:hypothetical protein
MGSPPDFMFTDAEKEEFKRIVDRFVEQRRCFRPTHPDEVLKEVKHSKGIDDSAEEGEPAEVVSPRFQL